MGCFKHFKANRDMSRFNMNVQIMKVMKRVVQGLIRQTVVIDEIWFVILLGCDTTKAMFIPSRYRNTWP